jgi:MFS family permease
MQLEERKAYNKLWTKQYIFILLVSLLLSIGFNMQNNILPLYALKISGRVSLASLMTGAFSLTALFFRPIFGNLLDNLGRRLVLVGGIMAFCLVSFSYTFAYIPFILVTVRILQGVCFSAYSTATGTVVADIVPPKRLMEGIGYFGMGNTIATAIGPAIAFALIKKTSYNVVFVLCTILAVGSCILTFLIKYEEKGKREIGIEIKQRKSKAKISIIERTAIPTGITLFFITITTGCVLTFLPAYALTRGIDNIGMYYTVNAVALLLTRLFIGRIADSYGYSKIIIPALVLLMISLIVLSQAISLSIFFIAGFLNGLASGTLLPILNSFVIKLSPIERRGIANATYFSSIDIGITVGALMGGIISKNFGYPALFLVTAGCVMFSLAEYCFVLRLQLKRQENTAAASVKINQLEMQINYKTGSQRS